MTPQHFNTYLILTFGTRTHLYQPVARGDELTEQWRGASTQSPTSRIPKEKQ
jgi:hypothetical protein